MGRPAPALGGLAQLLHGQKVKVAVGSPAARHPQASGVCVTFLDSSEKLSQVEYLGVISCYSHEITPMGDNLMGVFS